MPIENTIHLQNLTQFMRKTKSEYVKVRKSGIHNKGIFAKKDIPKGTKVIEYVGEKITKKESDKRADRVIEEHKRKEKKKGSVYIFELNNKYDLDGYPKYNTARWINHSCDPNCETENINNHIWIIAIKDIKKGEEISYDYGYSLDEFEEHPCRCGSKNCVGYIVDEKHRKKLKKILAKKNK